MADPRPSPALMHTRLRTTPQLFPSPASFSASCPPHLCPAHAFYDRAQAYSSDARQQRQAGVIRWDSKRDDKMEVGAGGEVGGQEGWKKVERRGGEERKWGAGLLGDICLRALSVPCFHDTLLLPSPMPGELLLGRRTRLKGKARMPNKAPEEPWRGRCGGTEGGERRGTKPGGEVCCGRDYRRDAAAGAGRRRAKPETTRGWLISATEACFRQPPLATHPPHHPTHLSLPRSRLHSPLWAGQGQASAKASPHGRLHTSLSGEGERLDAGVGLGWLRPGQQGRGCA